MTGDLKTKWRLQKRRNRWGSEMFIATATVPFFVTGVSEESVSFG